MRVPHSHQRNTQTAHYHSEQEKITRHHRASLFGSLKFSLRRHHFQQPLFKFGLVADIQYALKDTQMRTHRQRPSRRMGWCEALTKVHEAVEVFNQHDLQFVLSLGDIIEGNEHYLQNVSQREMQAVLDVLKHSTATVRHILGNHCRRVSKPKLVQLLGLHDGTYYHFSPATAWRVVCLDTTELCAAAVDAPQHERAAVAKMVAALHRPNHNFHGAVSETQLSWLDGVLRQASNDGERVIIMTHYPLKAARASHLALNSAAILDVINASGANVVAVFSGHDHDGATLLPDSRNASKTAFITLPALVESPCDSNAFATVAVFPDGSLEMTGYGTVQNCRVRPVSKHA